MTYVSDESDEDRAMEDAITDVSGSEVSHLHISRLSKSASVPSDMSNANLGPLCQPPVQAAVSSCTNDRSCGCPHLTLVIVLSKH